jgi:membrane protease subunit (stomatin/prohibitin family)
VGLFDKIRGEFIDIVEWVDDTHRALVWRFPRYQNEIKNGAQLIVRPGQIAVFVHQGKLADVFEEGRHELTTGNLPILSTLQGWKYGFDSPFRSEVYFVSTRQVTDLKWGTPNPVMLRDADFGPIRLRAFGTYALKAVEPKILVRELVGTDSRFDADAVTELVRSIINTAFADLIGEAKIAALDLASRYRELSDELRRRACAMIDDEYGLEVPLLNIVNISLPEAVEKALDARTSMGVIGDLGRYQQFQMANAVTAAAENPGGAGAAMGMGVGMGFAMANPMMYGMQGGPAAAGGAPPPPPPPPAPLWHATAGGQALGPWSTQQLVQAIASGQMARETLVWSAGMAGWMPAAQVPQLAAYLGAAPPPPPPPPAPSSGSGTT